MLLIVWNEKLMFVIVCLENYSIYITAVFCIQIKRCDGRVGPNLRVSVPCKVDRRLSRELISLNVQRGLRLPLSSHLTQRLTNNQARVSRLNNALGMFSEDNCTSLHFIKLRI